MIAYVLVIESNRELRENVCEMLELCNYTVLGVEDGIAGYEMARTHRPHCIVCDLLSPKSQGDAFMHLISIDRDISNIPMVLTSAHDSFQFPIKELKSVMLRKPYNGNELVDKIKEAMLLN